MDIGTVSSDDVIASYRNQLAEAHHQIAILQAQLAKAVKMAREVDRPSLATPPTSSKTPSGGDV